MGKFILRRLGVSVFILFAVSVIIFCATLLLPGSPATAILGQQATPERIAALEAEMNLDQPPVTRYLLWLGGIFTGDLGTSTSTGGPVSELLGEPLVNSLVLMLLAAAISIPVGVLLGVYAAWWRGYKRDSAITWVTLILAALPEFVIGIALVTLFATSVFQILPAVTMSPPGSRVWEFPMQLVLPTLTLAFVVTPYVARMTRATMIEALESGYVEMARLKGVPERRVVFRHALPHAVGPIAQVVAIQLAWLAGGIVVVEYLFRYPGLGVALIDAVNYRDVQVVQAVSLLIAAVYVVVNLLADLVSIAANPKLRSN
ncbi:peptide/nickel transport system permease protein [Corynebacterium coyleae]|uniref:ABC transporter permease n=1 Tax=Corynebacterium coyleae TaxID=53374 RepID=A0AAP6XLT3_9CORY|nr:MULTISPECIES: ABC transporter permease [Corynebacterium]MDK6493647.1 ABC transporter permease [Corynebacterium coyleae]MDK8241463.1 ABC transporter permease [Corynebacterium coyleae]MDK8798731.1 ABC transporter permease [Corynebacterium coyleae]MDK8824126.1 ABC transporter permease [Corynebacterium coyleae]NJJ04569.1 ABC transporter permease [Corynebacterium coyleae]